MFGFIRTTSNSPLAVGGVNAQTLVGPAPRFAPSVLQLFFALSHSPPPLLKPRV